MDLSQVSYHTISYPRKKNMHHLGSPHLNHPQPREQHLLHRPLHPVQTSAARAKPAGGKAAESQRWSHLGFRWWKKYSDLGKDILTSLSSVAIYRFSLFCTTWKREQWQMPEEIWHSLGMGVLVKCSLIIWGTSTPETGEKRSKPLLVED